VAPAFLSTRSRCPGSAGPRGSRRFLFVICGALRLARFNVHTGSADRRFFIGLPTPAAAGVIARA
jgi:CDP-diacylglycerol--serine O-phosphatidyltransferase